MQIKKDEQKLCSRCDLLFTDRDIKVILSEETNNFIEKTYYSFLCNDCLKEINNLVQIAKDNPLNGNKIIEGVHYYKDKDYLIFTEFYHLLKGSCCKNRCKHCAYGYK